MRANKSHVKRYDTKRNYKIAELKSLEYIPIKLMLWKVKKRKVIFVSLIANYILKSTRLLIDVLKNLFDNGYNSLNDMISFKTGLKYLNSKLIIIIANWNPIPRC